MATEKIFSPADPTWENLDDHDLIELAKEAEDGGEDAFLMLIGESVGDVIRRHLVPPAPGEEGFFLIREGKDKYTIKERVRRKDGKVTTRQIGLPARKKNRVMKFFVFQEFARRDPERKRFRIDFDGLVRDMLKIDY